MKNFLVLNWKAGPETLEEAKKIVIAVRRISKTAVRTAMVICPPFIYLEPVSKMLLPRGKTLLGSQDVSSTEGGPETGEVSAQMVRNIGAAFAIVGHSERRQLGETSELAAKKVNLAVRSGLFVVLCVGEPERDSHGRFFRFLSEQLRLSLAKISRRQLPKIIIAYEPVFAIGKSEQEAMKAPELRETVIFIRKVLADLFGQPAALAVPILYGGSVGGSNAVTLFHDSGVQGFLLGRASLKPADVSFVLKVVDPAP